MGEFFGVCEGLGDSFVDVFVHGFSGVCSWKTVIGNWRVLEEIYGDDGDRGFKICGEGFRGCRKLKGCFVFGERLGVYV
ncbi:hypothetical protein Hanom_Chr07g00635951 [Helianthus anomalus]